MKSRIRERNRNQRALQKFCGDLIGSLPERENLKSLDEIVSSGGQESSAAFDIVTQNKHRELIAMYINKEALSKILPDSMEVVLNNIISSELLDSTS